DVAILEDRRARRTGALRMCVGQETLAHAHWQKRNAALLDEVANGVVRLRVGPTLTEDDQGVLGAFQHVECTFDRIRTGNLRGRCIDDLHERFFSSLRRYHLTEQLGWQIEIDTTRTARDRGADRPRK